MTQRILITLASLLLALSACATNPTPPPTQIDQQPGVNLPVNYQTEYVQYARVERSDGTVRDLYISPDALRNYRRGGSLPDYTTVVIEGYDAALDENGEFLRDEQGQFVKGEPFEALHVIQKRNDWTTTDFESAARTGNWNFGSFDRISGQNFDESLTACSNCHNGTPQTDFLYSRILLDQYAQSELVQYFYCNLRGRAVC